MTGEKVIFTNRNNTEYDSVSYSGSVVKNVEHHKHLGFILGRNMNYSKHIREQKDRHDQNIV